MGFIDLVRELRTGNPDHEKAVKTVRFLGWGCLFVALWNIVLPQMVPSTNRGFPFPANYLNFAIVSFSLIGGLFLLSARAIQEMRPWGKRAGQTAIALLFLNTVLLSAMMVPQFFRFPSASKSFDVIFYAFLAIPLAQFGVLAYYGLRYLSRLPIKDESYIHYNPEELSHPVSERIDHPSAKPGVAAAYKDSPSPFGVFGTFILLLTVPLLAIAIAVKYVGPTVLALMPLVFLFILGGPAVFNYAASPFQENRRLVAAFTGGGSVFLFHGSWPFFRLIVYEDALEVRFMFHRFLIPYAEMEDIPKVGFFSTGMLIKSGLPDVPTRIRFSGFGLKKIVQLVNETRSAFLATRTPPGPPSTTRRG